MVYVLKCNAEEGKLVHSPYYVPKDVIDGNGLTFGTREFTLR